MTSEKLDRSLAPGASVQPDAAAQRVRGCRHRFGQMHEAFRGRTPVRTGYGLEHRF